MSRAAILRYLAHGPATNAALADATCDHSGSIARTCSDLIRTGRVRRIDGGAGRGSRAVYALTEKAS